MSLARLPVLLALATLSMTAAGCFGGGDESSSSESGGRLSRAELTRRADVACTSAAERIKALKSPTSLGELAGYAARVKQIGAQLEKTITGLDATSADERRLLPYTAALRGANEAAGELARGARRRDRGVVRSAADRIASLDLGALAAQAGLARCATAGTFGGAA